MRDPLLLLLCPVFATERRERYRPPRGPALAGAAGRIGTFGNLQGLVFYDTMGPGPALGVPMLHFSARVIQFE